MSSACPSPTEGVTRQLAHWVATVEPGAISERARRCAGHALLDWTGVTLAARAEPLVEALVADAVANGETGAARLIGRAETLSPAFAALVNGAASHALDFDDVNQRLHGHPTVVVVPALLAAAPACDASGSDVIDALVIGTEVSCAVGAIMGDDHYNRGFHATATVGCIGAVAAVGRLMGFDAARTTTALSIAASQASGLKANFGTMTKPLHAGCAAMSGLLAARWAASGLTASDNALESRQGMGVAMSTEFVPDFTPPGRRFGIEDNCYKYYPACYLTHSAIAATLALRDEHGLTPNDVDGVDICLLPTHDRVCNIADPQDGLGIKFSVPHLIAMALSGDDVGDPGLYTAATATRPDLVALRKRIHFQGAELSSRWAGRITLTCGDGQRLERDEDVGIPAEDLGRQEALLMRKFGSLVTPALGSDRADELAAGALTMAAADGPATLFDHALP
ncbi:MAG: MmgE/PrpD family protein [Rhodospirillales bacterium]|nr:MmgE/PrpD family protein [Rhodospirillales bacterium]